MLFMWTRLLRKHSATAAGWHRYKRRSTTTAPRDLQDRVQEHTSSRSFDRVQEGGHLHIAVPRGGAMSLTLFVGGQEGPQRAGGRGGHPSARHIACSQIVGAALARTCASVGGWLRM